MFVEANSVDSITINIEGVDKTVAVDNFEGISWEAIKVFNDIVPELKFISWQGRLGCRVRRLYDAQQNLEAAEQHPNRDKIFMLLRSALNIAILVGGILGVIALAPLNLPAAFALGLVTWGAYLAFGFYNWKSATNGKHMGGEGCLVPFIGPFAPIYEIF